MHAFTSEMLFSTSIRVADERNEFLGTSVGYQIRLTNESPRSYGSVVYCTTGVVLRWLKSDPQLTRISHLVLDEVHERDILSDFLMVIVRDLLLLRPDLRVILMSATMDVESFMNYFKNFNPVLKSVRGRLYNVQKYFLEDVFAETGYCPPTVSTKFCCDTGGYQLGNQSFLGFHFQKSSERS